MIKQTDNDAETGQTFTVTGSVLHISTRIKQDGLAIFAVRKFCSGFLVKVDSPDYSVKLTYLLRYFQSILKIPFNHTILTYLPPVPAELLI